MSNEFEFDTPALRATHRALEEMRQPPGPLDRDPLWPRTPEELHDIRAYYDNTSDSQQLHAALDLIGIAYPMLAALAGNPFPEDYHESVRAREWNHHARAILELHHREIDN